MGFDKSKMINKLLDAKDIVIEVYDETEISEVGNVMCDIDEAIAVIDDKTEEES